ncbi:MAG TPA: SIR2 family protein [Thermoanaerobaculia bacterium]|nr:SIR2 family protein [Thermoanaerobaculia bacterium]
MTRLVDEASPAYATLRDLVASDRLLVVTGSGISAPMKRADGTRMPQWSELLRDIMDATGPTLDDDTRAACKVLLDVTPADGEMLIEAATMLERIDPVAFASAFRAQVTPRAGETTDTHRAIVKVNPRGVLTFNYDEGHENAWREAGADVPEVLLPYDEQDLVTAIRGGLAKPFILKAHGSLDSSEPLVLSYVAYRDLLAKRPAYRAFLHHLLTNFSMLIVGFSGIDPDFNLLMNTLVEEFGSPIHPHVLIRKVDATDAKQEAHAVLSHRRHGIETLWVSDFPMIPALLEKSLHTPGPKLEAVLRDAVKGGPDERRRAHRHFRDLGPTGRVCAQGALKKMLADPTLTASGHYVSEIAYSLGTIDPEGNKELLMQIVEDELLRGRADPPARALTVLRGALLLSDRPRIERWLTMTGALRDDPEQRIDAYLRYLLVYVKHRWNSDKSRPV